MPIEVKMPKLGESVTEGTIGRWLKRPGEQIAKYEPLLEVTTDKVDTEVTSTVDGMVFEILIPEGETVKVGTVLGRIVETGETRLTSDTSEAGGSTDAQQSAGAAPVSPVVARLAAEHGLDLSRISGTGTNGRITKKDVEQYLAAGRSGTVTAQPALAALQETMQSGLQASTGAATPVTSSVAQIQASETREHVPALASGDAIVPLSPMRRAIAEHMVRSKRTVPHVTTVMEADLSHITRHRERVRQDYERQGVRLTFTPYFVQAAVAALRAVPIANASYSDEGIVMHSRINIGVAVAIPDGLLVPVIKDAGDRSLLGLARSINELAERARSRRLVPDEVQDGTFTITNHGISGSLFAMPIINQPQAAILGIGAIEKRVVVISEGGMDSIAIRPRAYLSLTFDHRVMDGASADQFLATLKTAIEQFDD